LSSGDPKKRKIGRPKGSKNGTSVRAVTAMAGESARLGHAVDGKLLLPHEILLRVANGGGVLQRKLEVTYYAEGPQRGQEKCREWVVEEYFPSFVERLDAAKAAAPYYAPRLASQTLAATHDTVEALSGVLEKLSFKLPG
jgi:hypothetical protein